MGKPLEKHKHTHSQTYARSESQNHNSEEQDHKHTPKIRKELICAYGHTIGNAKTHIHTQTYANLEKPQTQTQNTQRISLRIWADHRKHINSHTHSLSQTHI